MSLEHSASTGSTRREFLRTSTAATLGGMMAVSLNRPFSAAAANTDTLKIGLVGCGGRGTGAASQALHADPNVVLVSMGDVFDAQIKNSLGELTKDASIKDRVKVDPGHCFIGLDGYQKVIASGVDVVLLASPPGFRPQQIKAAIAAGKHVFAEKPMATDAPGVRTVLEAVEAARARKLAVGAGFCWRYDDACRALYKRIHDGAIGEVRAVHATYLTGPVKPMPPASSRPAGMSDVEWQIRNWYNFVWLSGDGLVEQACHSVDKIAWAMNGLLPVRAVASGGRQIPNNEGNIFDHIEVMFEYENGVRAFMSQRQIANCFSENGDCIMGATGIALGGWNPPVIRGPNRWRHDGPNPGARMYQTEHNELFASIRAGTPINDGIWMAHSTLMALMGRTAAYTGKEVTWEHALSSKDQLVPENLTWDMKLPIAPMAVPGQTRLV